MYKLAKDKDKSERDVVGDIRGIIIERFWELK